MEALLDFFDPTESQQSPPRRSERDPLPSSLPPEVEVGNVEYKLKLLNPTASRFEHLVTQMKWRLREGQGEAIYAIGVADSGMLLGLSDTEMDDSIATLKSMADRLGATLSILRKSEVQVGSAKRSKGEKMTVAEVLVRKVPDDQQFLDVRVAVVGPVDAGKSTLLGVMTQGELDNGRGRARLNLFRHLHEIQSGHTSSIGHEILGFDSKGEVVDYSSCVSAEEICERASKLITFIDLAGHQKYMKTTIFGLTAHCPDFAMLVVGANSGVVGTACDHLGFSVALKVPTMVVVTKSDLCSPSQANHTIEKLEQILKSVGCNKKPFRVNSESDACLAAQKSNDPDFAPIFLVSCVTGENLDLLQKFLNAVPPSRSHCSQEQLEQHLPEFQTDEIFNVPEVGTVLGGTLTRGVLREGDKVMVGPREDGVFVETTVATIRRNRTPCRMVRARQAATVTLTHVERTDVRKGTVILSSLLKMDESCNTVKQFEADIYMLYNTNGGIKPGFQGTVYVNSIMQNADIVKIKERESLSAGERARVQFRFLKSPELLRVGAKVLFREGRTKGIGEIKRLIPDSECVEGQCLSSSPHRRKPSR